MSIAKRDVLELRRRMTKKSCTIDWLCGCYVDGGKNVVLKFSESFSDLPEEEYYKYLEIAKKAMSGSLNSNLLELNFQRGETGDEHQRYLYTLKASKMQNPELLDRLYEKIIDSYAAEGNYLILVFHDVYDVIAQTKDHKRLDESSETSAPFAPWISPSPVLAIGRRRTASASPSGTGWWGCPTSALHTPPLQATARTPAR